VTYYSEPPRDSAVTDATTSTTAGPTGPVSPSVNDSDGVNMPSERSEDMPSFDEWKQKEQEKTKNSSGLDLSLSLLVLLLGTTVFRGMQNFEPSHGIFPFRMN